MQDIEESIVRYCRRHGMRRWSPEAALVDMDGTLYDSMPAHARAWYRTMTDAGFDCTPEEFYLYEGRTGASTINLLMQRQFSRAATEEECVELYGRKSRLFATMGNPAPIDGAREAMASLLRMGLTTVLVTGSGQDTVLRRLDDDFPGAFPEGRRVTGRDVRQGKPHPEPFLHAMRLIGKRAETCIAIDNAPLGVESGAASGAFTIGVTTGPVPAEALYEAGADIVFPSMRELAMSVGRVVDRRDMPL